jgi:ABC-type transport system substrate-binding protein
MTEQQHLEQAIAAQEAARQVRALGRAHTGNRLVLQGSYARRYWQDEPFERLIKQAKHLIDQRERMELYQQADRILVQEAAIIPLGYARYSWLRKPWLTVLFSDRISRVGVTKDIFIRPH